MRFKFSPKLILVLIIAVFLSSCQYVKDSNAWKKPLPSHLVNAIKKKGFTVGGRILARLYKTENRFEIWMEKNGKYKYFKSYRICSWSGKLGPKVKEGDHQAPEGFYVVTPAQMNPRSQFYLSFNLGYPNFYDRAHGRTGSHLMVHGECSSRGCYALDNRNIEEVYLLARDAFKNGQRRFHVQAYPFRMTEANLEKYKNHKWIDFWRNLAEGDRLFRQTGVPAKMTVRNKRYVFTPGDALVAQKPAWGKDIELYKQPPLEEAIARPEKAPMSRFNSFNDTPLADLIKELPKPEIKEEVKTEATPQTEPADTPAKVEETAPTTSPSSLYNGSTPLESNTDEVVEKKALAPLEAPKEDTTKAVEKAKEVEPNKVEELAPKAEVKPAPKADDIQAKIKKLEAETKKLQAETEAALNGLSSASKQADKVEEKAEATTNSN